MYISFSAAGASAFDAFAAAYGAPIAIRTIFRVAVIAYGAAIRAQRPAVLTGFTEYAVVAASCLQAGVTQVTAGAPFVGTPVAQAAAVAYPVRAIIALKAGFAKIIHTVDTYAARACLAIRTFVAPPAVRANLVSAAGVAPVAIGANPVAALVAIAAGIAIVAAVFMASIAAGAVIVRHTAVDTHIAVIA